MRKINSSRKGLSLSARANDEEKAKQSGDTLRSRCASVQRYNPELRLSFVLNHTAILSTIPAFQVPPRLAAHP